ncbi:hypothetical protein ANN_23376 [Periplaneta americana]|uniref:Uncharacterized protein n=1 Tax=Periplaneta americana TaxID=6978 RepID=A0ABQ8SMY7_PERAM|nr:hypothetical protein ANN_23376 [Periplaneta americana]
MAGLCKGGNEPPDSLKASNNRKYSAFVARPDRSAALDWVKIGAPAPELHANDRQVRPSYERTVFLLILV